MTRKFDPRADHPAVPTLIRLHSMLGGKMLENKNKALPTSWLARHCQRIFSWLRSSQSESGQSLWRTFDRLKQNLLRVFAKKNIVASKDGAAVTTSDRNPTRDQSMLWGSPIEFWDLWGVRLLVVGALVGVGGLVLSALSAYVLYRVADLAQKNLESESKSSAERIAIVNNETARLQADNLALQTVLLPRHVGLFGINEHPKAAEWFAGMETFAGTEFVIVFADDSEAQNLANEIATVLRLHGLTASLDSNRTTGPTPDGVTVSYPLGPSWTSEVPNRPWFGWAKAAAALAQALTKAGLAVGDRTVRSFGFPPLPEGVHVPFAPVRSGVLVQVGSRPVMETVAWIKDGRPDVNGVSATPIGAKPKQ